MRRRREQRRGQVIVPVFLCLVTGGVIGWFLRGHIPAPTTAVVVRSASAHERPAPPVLTADPPSPSIHAPVPDTGGLLISLRKRQLRLPLEGAKVAGWKEQFNQRRGGGTRGHEAVDLLAPRNTPIHAVDNGTIAKLFFSKAGGNTIYAFDEEGRACYYYAHLERYADGLREGQTVRAGDLLGYVGTTGNAPPDTPHLHFAIFELTPARKWWEGQPIDPFLVYGPT